MTVSMLFLSGESRAAGHLRSDSSLTAGRFRAQKARLTRFPRHDADNRRIHGTRAENASASRPGRASIFSSVRARMMSFAVAPQRCGSISITVNHRFARPYDASGINSTPCCPAKAAAYASNIRRRAAIFNHAQLSAPDGGQHVAQPVTIADLAMLIMRRRVARLR